LNVLKADLVAYNYIRSTLGFQSDPSEIFIFFSLMKLMIV